jgi:hypothetical protein
MSELRKATKEAILRELDESVFTRYGFTCEFNPEDGLILRIRFKDRPEFAFGIFEDPNAARIVGGEPWTVVASPGEIFNEPEDQSYQAFHQALSRLADWLVRLTEEIVVPTSEGATTALLEEFEKRLESLAEPDQPFSLEEAADWRARLDRFVEQVDVLQEQHDVDRDELRKLRSDVERLKGNVESLPKKAWLRAAGGQILRWANNKVDTALIAAVQTAMRITMLGPGL